MELAHTRALVNAVLSRSLEQVGTRTDPVFGLQVPLACPGVPAALLDPRSTWRDPAAYDAQARWLAGQFRDNFNAFADTVDAKVRAAGPRLGDEAQG